tara:strand:+ start:5103 stop:6362 length:1260 start_codon:yes stop_codon:yes gene_type:complete
MDTTILTINNVWMMIATALVFFMHLGFSFLEIGLTRQKNTINILFKNLFIICIGLLLYCLIGFNLMYPNSFFYGVLPDYFIDLFGLNAPIINSTNGEEILDLAYNAGYTYWTDFLFQGMFAATAATIVSGAVAERIRIDSFMLFTILYVGIIYPIVGSWKWGGGFIDKLGFYDFAGSTIVHSVGGWAALIAVYLLGPRIGKFNEDGTPNVILGHNMPLATAGVLILWLGWFGFNGGSVLSADPTQTSLVLVTTSLAAAAGGIAAFAFTLFRYKNYDISMFLNGILAGLVGITAGANLMSPTNAIFIGMIAGILVVIAITTLDKLKLDDPVGAISVHLVCGVWGTLAVGLLGSKAGIGQFFDQLIGIGVIAIFCLSSSFLIFFTIKKTIGLRVSPKEEIQGLDNHEHGAMAYPDFAENKH